MLIRTDPFRELDRMAHQALGTTAQPAVMPMDAWRENDRFVMEFDLPAVDPASIDLDVERNVLTVRATRRDAPARDVEMIAAERPRGVFSRQVLLGDVLDTDRIQAAYEAGVLRLVNPVAERAKPRKITISASDTGRQSVGTHGGVAREAVSADAMDAMRGSPIAGGPADREQWSQEEIDELFLDIVLGDPELIAAEFDALVGALAGGPLSPRQSVDCPSGGRCRNHPVDRTGTETAGCKSAWTGRPHGEPRVRSPPARIW